MTQGSDRTHLSLFEVLVDLHLGRRRLFLFEAVLPLANAAHELLVVLGHVPLDRIVAVLADHALEQVSNLDLEVVRVLVRPVHERRNERRERRSHEGGVEGDDGDLDEPEAGLDDLSVRRAEEDDNRLEEFGLVLVLERGCVQVIAASIVRTRRKPASSVWPTHLGTPTSSARAHRSSRQSCADSLPPIRH